MQTIARHPNPYLMEGLMMNAKRVEESAIEKMFVTKTIPLLQD
ncbi:MAG TPA: hypothetical protein VFU89_04380 [Rhabdochlamydiaceae bacterium]|nr:hypothetical protein [Rhabdochlamydiaceae bacterium]